MTDISTMDNPMLLKESSFTVSDPLRAAILSAYRMDETECIENLLIQAELPLDSKQAIANNARQLVEAVRKQRIGQGGLDAFLYQYDLSSEEGIALMCLAEAMLRVPDSATADKLIRDKIVPADWALHQGKSESLLVNAATWGLMLTGKILAPSETTGLRGTLKRVLERTSEPVIRQAVAQAMKILGQQFVMGRTIGEALKRASEYEAKGYRYSYDMLGEAARTQSDADRYFSAYQQAIKSIGEASAASQNGQGIYQGPGISVKLSAIHPRYEFAKRERVLKELVPRLKELALQAKAANIGFTIDAEESERLDLSLDVIEAVFSDPALNGWEGFGLAVQAYQKRAMPILDWLIDLSRRYQRRIMVRLVKGAYWDTEIKNSQVYGLEGYPVFTRKVATDVSYLACAKKMLSATDALYPQFATHNAYTVAAVLEMAGDYRDFEFQCLHGMGYTLYDQLVSKGGDKIPARVYAPVGSHEDLLAYLVRRLLENGANSSFVNRIVDEQTPIEDLIADPVEKLRELSYKPHSKIPLPAELFGELRPNSKGLDLTNANYVAKLNQDMSKGDACVAHPKQSTTEQIETAMQQANAAATNWDATPVEIRATCLERTAELLQERRATFMILLVKEAGKTIPDALSEIREAIDFCYYYAALARKDLASPHVLTGPTGEYNALQFHGRGVIACISPWNFPLAIFMGQVTAALVAGNPVIAKPAAQTPHIAAEAVKLLHDAGIPKEVLHLLLGSGRTVGAALVADLRVKGIVFTGSTETARSINQTLAHRHGPLVPFVAETGGQNAMIVDSSALPEQVIADVVNSAFGSAGQRCSALRVLFVQTDIAPKILTMLKGAMAELQVGDPGLLSTDIGPVIDGPAKNMLEAHKARMLEEAQLIYAVPVASNLSGTFFAPCAFEIDSLTRLKREVFGPILHVIRYKANELDNVLDQINQTGYGLTLGIHSRIQETITYIQSRVRVGNIYVNRNMIGAVVGVQPFGGEGLSGTGPKAGGPEYLKRLCVERTVCINTTAAGGNATLMSLDD
jgi:RHH-type proline utilization regulon transcriptional repressor/proline dehydrogenase/delta 1-pyrroline-5-carboxylate dehydrogenase